RRRASRRLANRAAACGPQRAADLGPRRVLRRANPLPAAAAKHARRGVLAGSGREVNYPAPLSPVLGGEGRTVGFVMPIFDQGYQHWKGPLAGHAWRWLAIARHGVRVQLKNRILRILLILAWLPALTLVVAVALWGLVEQKSAGVMGLVGNILPAEMLLDAKAYRTTFWTLAYSIFFKVEMYLIMLAVVVAGPGLISRDLRFNALPLYFSRPLTRL